MTGHLHSALSHESVVTSYSEMISHIMVRKTDGRTKSGGKSEHEVTFEDRRMLLDALEKV